MTEPASDELLAEIERGLEGVTPGPWGYVPMPLTKEGNGPAEPHETVITMHEVWDDTFLSLAECRHELNARHIARCNPDNISAIFERLRKAEAERDEAKWRPIETAPRHALSVLLYDPNRITDVFQGAFDFSDGVWRDTLGVMCNPINWMYMPEPPKEAAR